MLRIDFFSLLQFGAVVQMVVAASLFLIWQRDRRSYLSLWAAGLVLYAIGQYLIGIRSILPEFLAIPIANTLLIAGAVLMLKGTNRFFGRTSPNLLLAALVLTVFVLFVDYTYFSPNLAVRVVVHGVAIVGLTLGNAFILIRNRDREIGPICSIGAGLFVMLAIGQTMRVVYGMHSLVPDDFTKLAGFGAFFMFILVLVNVGIGLSFSSLHTASLFAGLKALSHTDPLTGLYNRRALDSLLAVETNRSNRQGSPLSVLMIDIDHFKQLNDRFGHHAGDEGIRKVAERIKETLRPYDIAVRYGGEEFCVLLPHTGAEEAKRIARRIQAGPFVIMATEVMEAVFTLSIGVSTLAPRENDGETAVRRADAALYEAKRGGRNQVVEA